MMTTHIEAVSTNGEVQLETRLRGVADEVQGELVELAGGAVEHQAERGSVPAAAVAVEELLETRLEHRSRLVASAWSATATDWKV